MEYQKQNVNRHAEITILRHFCMHVHVKKESSTTLCEELNTW